MGQGKPLPSQEIQFGRRFAEAAPATVGRATRNTRRRGVGAMGRRIVIPQPQHQSAQEASRDPLAHLQHSGCRQCDSQQLAPVGRRRGHRDGRQRVHIRRHRAQRQPRLLAARHRCRSMDLARAGKQRGRRHPDARQVGTRRAHVQQDRPRTLPMQATSRYAAARNSSTLRGSRWNKCAEGWSPPATTRPATLCITSLDRRRRPRRARASARASAVCWRMVCSTPSDIVHGCVYYIMQGS